VLSADAAGTATRRSRTSMPADIIQELRVIEITRKSYGNSKYIICYYPVFMPLQVNQMLLCFIRMKRYILYG
jgi:hypothetical protein